MAKTQQLTQTTDLTDARLFGEVRGERLEDSRMRGSIRKTLSRAAKVVTLTVLILDTAARAGEGFRRRGLLDLARPQAAV